MKKLNLVILLITLICLKANAGQTSYNCHSPRPEMSGFHNMVLFGNPEEKIYTYHLPLFKGKVNGLRGHVSMHVYQGIWDITLDQSTLASYKNKFNAKKSIKNPFPFFSIGPRGQKFKVPEMICNKGFKTKVLSVYGHIEGNPNFPSPKPVLNQLSDLEVNKTIFARRFDETSKGQLTYILFGSEKQLYLAHYLTDDENSYDQIVAIKTNSSELKEKVKNGTSLLVSIPLNKNESLVKLPVNGTVQSLNNKLTLPVKPLGQSFIFSENGKDYRAEVTGNIYFNSNDDLKKNF